ncbi:MAG TPA: hypothetical protein VF584_17350 [Longimicrobium sp.]|jgi:hypothetical protein
MRILIATAALLFTAASASAQSAPLMRIDSLEQAARRARNDNGRAAAASALGLAYAELAADSAASKLFVGVTVAGYVDQRDRAQSAVQVSQLADEAILRLAAIEAAQRTIIVQQNARIIELLGQLVRQQPR